MATVSEVTPMEMVYFELPTEMGRSGLTVFARRGQLQLDKEATSNNLHDVYAIGTEHQCRVLDYRMMDRLLIVTNKTAMLAQKMISVSVSAPSTVGITATTRGWEIPYSNTKYWS